MTAWVFFLLLSALLLVFTLSRPHKHRFYRFFAFESLLGLLFLNARRWFLNPFSPLQIASWAMLSGSLVLAFHGFYLLRVEGAPSGDIENTTELVTKGAYRYIRHPLYCSLFLCGLGAYLKAPTLVGLVVLAVLVTFVYLTARVEEQDNLKRFGEAYRDYMKNTKMLIPFLI